MINKEQAQKLLPLANSNLEWQGLESYLKELAQTMRQQLVVVESELELRRLQGKLALLETLINLKDATQATIKAHKDGNTRGNRSTI